jgi:hypothetical protein
MRCEDINRKKNYVRDKIKLAPGPGYYKLPSDFGHYISKNVLEKDNAEKKI